MASLDQETSQAVLRQVEFYFSDSNIPTDEFLRRKISESPDSMISLALICSFKKMKDHLNLANVKPEEIPEDTLKAVAETLRKSSSLKLSEDGKKVGRTSELPTPEEMKEQLDLRTIAATPLEYYVKREDLVSFFSQYAKVNSVRLPRHLADKRLFCGTALIEISTAEDAEKVLKQSLVYAGVELELRPKKDFDAERTKEEEEFEKSHPAIGSNRKNNLNADVYYPKGLVVAFTLKNKLFGSSEDKNGSQKPVDDNANACKIDGEPDSSENAAKESNQNTSENDNSCKGKIEEKNELEGIEMDGEDADKTSDGCSEKGEEKEKNAIDTYKNNMDVVLREDLKSVCQKFGIVKYIDFKIGANSGYIRFEEPEAAQKARAAAVLAKEGGLTVKNFLAVLEPVTGEAEKEYWSLLRGNQERHRETKGGFRGRGGKSYRGGKHGRFRENDSARGRPNKARKVGAA